MSAVGCGLSRAALLAWLMLAATISMAQTADDAQPRGLERNQHAWARFAPGAWKRVRVVTETLDPDGRVVSTSVQETTTHLDRVEKDAIALRTEGTIEVGGQRLESPAQTVVQGFSGQSADAMCQLRSLPEGAVTVEGESITCRVEQVEVTTSTSHTVTTNYYADGRAPYLLKSESNTRELATDGIASQATMTVTAFDLPFSIRGAIHATSALEMVQRHPKGSTLTRAYSSLEVPGGIVAYSSRERDAEGRLVRRSVLELLDFQGELVEPPTATPAP